MQTLDIITKLTYLYIYEVFLALECLLNLNILTDLDHVYIMTVIMVDPHTHHLYKVHSLNVIYMHGCLSGSPCVYVMYIFI